MKYRPDHNGECLNCDEPASEHDAEDNCMKHDWEKLIMLEPMLKFFQYEHLPQKLQDMSKKFSLLAIDIAENEERTPERTVALRKLLEAKDAAVRNRL
jgi:hypothetical protein